MFTSLFVIIGFIALLALLCDVEPLTGEAEFQKKVLDGMGAITGQVKGLKDEFAVVKSEQQKLMENYGNLDKETKKAFEELTKVKNTTNDVAKISNELRKVEIALHREQRMAFADPVQRIIADDEKRARFNAMIRMAVNKDGDMNPVAKEICKALGEDAVPGANLITVPLAQDIYDTLLRYGSWGKLGVRRMSSKQEKLITKTARPIFYVYTEAAQLPDDANKANAFVTAEARMIAGLINVSLQLIQDAEMDVVADVMDDFIEAYNYRADYLAYNGTGANDTTNGAMTGLFNAATAAVAGAGKVTVADLQLEDFLRCLTTVDAAVLQRAAAWFMHQQILAKTCLVRDKNGRPLFQTALEVPMGAIGSILGYPVNPVSVAPSTDAAGQKVAVFGDPRSQAVGVRTDYSFEASDHFKWDYYQRSFRAGGRFATINRLATGSAVLTTAAQ